MARDASDTDAPTRRDYVKHGGALLAGGLLAGCTDAMNEGSGAAGTATQSEAATPTDTPTATEAAAETAASTSTETATDGAYTATLAPAGEVEFAEPPQSVFTVLTHHAGMALALGRGDDLTAIYAGGYYTPLWNKFLTHLDGVSVDWEDLPDALNSDKELLYELESDIHLTDPAYVSTLDNWSTEDVHEIRDNVAPWFGNKFSADHSQPPESWADSYEYYTLWEIFGRVATAFREEARYRELASVREEMLSTIEEGLPPESERPNAAMVLFSPEDGDMWGYKINAPGFLSAHVSPLGVTDALADLVGDDNAIDAETLFEADPDVILALGAMSESKSMADIREQLQSDPVMREITAVKNDRVHPQGARWQGPILNIFQTEMTAKQLYPEQFGEWPTYDSGPYPEIPADEQLFDRDRVATTITDGAGGS